MGLNILTGVGVIWVLQRGETRVSFQEKNTTESLFQQIFLRAPKPTGSCGDHDGATEPQHPRRWSRVGVIRKVKVSGCDLCVLQTLNVYIFLNRDHNCSLNTL